MFRSTLGAILALMLAFPSFAQDIFTNGVEISGGIGGNADLFVTDSSVLDGKTCIGNGCAIDQTFDIEALRLMGSNTSILLEDTSTNPDAPTNDWRITVNEQVSNGLERFAIEDITGATTPVTIMAGAPDNALFLSANGDVGVNTALPGTTLHVVDSGAAKLRLESNDFGVNQKWTFESARLSFTLRHDDGGDISVPVSIESGSPGGSFAIKDDGNIGMGTSQPDGKLHTSGGGVQLIYFESSNRGPVQVRFRTDSENRRFLAVNNADEVKSQVIFKDNEILFTGETDSGANRWMSVSQAGVVTQGPTCDPGPCDKVFDPTVFTVPSIEDHAAYMWENQHLKAVGPTGPETPVNLTQKMGGMLHELELAHIYIAEQHNRINDMQAEHARQIAAQAQVIAALAARLDALESR